MLSVMRDPASRLRDLAERIDTASLPCAEGQTVALIVFNSSNSPVSSGVASFHASFAVRAEVGAQPVLMRDEKGQVVPSVIAQETLGKLRDDGRRLWTLELRFLVADVPASGWRAYAASYAVPLSLSERDAARLKGTPVGGLLVVETRLHPGDLPTTGVLFDIMDAGIPSDDAA